jgi:acetylornithine deacetylase
MDPLSLVTLARTLVDIDSTTGREGDCGRWLAAYLRARGYRVDEQPVTDTRFNVLATLDAPRLAFSTHFDCVPPFFPSREESGRLYGRGSCDAKGILAAQVTAVERLRTEGIRDIALLFVVGEERGSDGARAANTIPNECRFLVNGEPTDSRLGAATRGAFRVKLAARPTRRIRRLASRRSTSCSMR